MNRYAVIDIGSNSVRLMFVANGKVLYKRLNTTRLGEGLAQTGRLKAAAVARSATAVADFYAQAQADGAETVVAFATAAVRSASNGKDFVLAVKARCGLSVEVLGGETEAEIGILGAFGRTDGAVLDIGGASTELVVQRGGNTVYKKSVDVGVVRLKDVCGDDISALKGYAATRVQEFADAPRLTNVYAIGGTATTLAALAMGLETYDSNRVTGCTLSAERLQGLADELSNRSIEEIAALPCVPQGRADVITQGAVWLITLMQALGINSLTTSDRDNLEGYAVRKGWTV